MTVFECWEMTSPETEPEIGIDLPRKQTFAACCAMSICDILNLKLLIHEATTPETYFSVPRQNQGAKQYEYQCTYTRHSRLPFQFPKNKILCPIPGVAND